MLHAVIMAGGAGTRFWPESRARRPKQLLPLVEERSMVQATVDRLAPLVPCERVLIATTADLAAAIAAQLPELSAGAILAEPCRRDTAPCIGLAALHVSRDDPDATMIVLPADHAIRDDDAFRRGLQRAADLVARSPERIVTFGIPPSYAATSFGYIERGERLQETPVGDRPASPAYRVVRFREKPDAATAAKYRASGGYYWNAGIFVWKARTILQAIGTHEPEMFAHLTKIAASQGTPAFANVLEREFAAIRGVSIDYAVMERAKDVVVIEAPFDWDDVGSWQAVARLRGADEDGNTVVGRHLGIDTQASIVRSTDDHLVVTVGLEEMIVVHTPDATLVAHRRDEESLRRVVEELRRRGLDEYL